jgi:hypothetical protein
MDFEECRALYERYLKRHPDVVSRVAKAIARRRSALLCYEAKHDECHRSVLARLLTRRLKGLDIYQLMSG